ncbi:MAG: ABC transporter substrate-binding protein [Flammeovirgaceae bacterium]|nr:ABC transporter substrate-binding protein [Flammeovirgaceae bacterium]
MRLILYCVFMMSLFIPGCTSERQENKFINESSDFRIDYADGFKVTHQDSIKWVEVVRPYQGVVSGHRYLLVKHGVEIPAHDKETLVIRIPIENLVCTSTTHIPLLDYLEETDKLIGFPTTEYISSTKMRQRIDAGNVVDLGVDKGMNLEKLIELSPTLVMGYSMSADIGQFKKIMEVGIPVIINSEYLERHPLGRAEWIKFMALFFDQETKADSIFRVIENEYNSVKESVNTIAQNPP